MSKAAVKISTDLLSNPLCEQDQTFLESMTALDTAMKRMDSFNQEKVNQIQKTVIDPLKKYGGVFPSLNMAVKRREQALQDYKRLQSKVEKYEEKEKTGPVMVKLHQAREELRPVKEDFEAKNKQLLEEMPKFYHSRIDYFQPSFEALIRAQVTEDEKVSTVKELIFARLNIPANQQRLLYKGKALADGHRLSDYAIGPEAKLNLVIRQTGEKTGALGVGSSSNTQDRVWQIVSSILARHFSPADASKVLEHLIKEYERSIQQLSLDDIERLAGRLLHPNGGSIDSSYMD
ncbi:hypothetical protein fugu_004382 [Takifugu bimaculatus]|uniref:Ubiquitin-like domain-containing protein n=1 Tax=Takifugu bimaculatus TaxID=433685 RepID=A0A4Z2BEL1_9TELE|nr:hypothetical protein fugu_004382 [Takifugu bimaculatus]